MKNELTTAKTITMTVANPAAPVDNQTVTIYVGTSAVLNVVLQNETGSDIILQSDSGLEIYMPSYFTAAEVQEMSITDISQPYWTPVFNSTDGTWMLNHSSGTWSAGASVAFTINGVLTNVSPTMDSLQVSFISMGGSNVPAQNVAAVSLTTPPVTTNVNLDSVLELEIEYDGVIYVSGSGNALTNSLYLNIKNKSGNPFYNGAALWQGNPKVVVSFVYGETAGALAPDDKSAAGDTGSAWAISAAVADNETGGWQISNPSPTSQSNFPVWVLSPASTNQDIIGTGADANVTFVFSNIFSFTPPDATQMYVQLSGFMQDENTKYNDEVFVLPIQKRTAPANGVTKFYGPAKIFIRDTQDVDVKLFWAGLYIASISLDSDATPDPIVFPYAASYPDTDTMVYDNFKVTLPQVSPGKVITFTLTGEDGNGETLNVPQFHVSIMQKPGIYAFTAPASVNFNLNQFATIAFNWKVYEAGKVEITSDHSSPFTAPYADTSLWTTDETIITLNALTAITTAVTFTLKAYDIHENLVDTATCVVNVVAVGWCDPKDQAVYSILTINGKVWMTQDYNYDDSASFSSGLQNSWQLSGEPFFFGRVYLYAAAFNNVPAGWKLPAAADWNALIYSANNPQELMGGGSIGIELEPGGMYSTTFGPSGQATTCWYWSVPSQPGIRASLMINGTDCAVVENPPDPSSGTWYMTVRYLMDS